MSLHKNGASFKGTFNKALAIGAALLTLTGTVGSLSAAYDPYYADNCCPDTCWDPCACELPDFVVYADFIYWQVHPEGLEYARKDGFGASAVTAVDGHGYIVSPECELEPGFRVGLVVDLGCCNWDFYAQYTWLNNCFNHEVRNPYEPTVGDGAVDLQPLIWNLGLNPDVLNPLSLARAEWDSTYNVLDFGLGRTFSVNCCFDFRPHLGFKATWQELKYKVRYESADTTTVTERVDIHNKTDFDGIGLRGGFDAAWRFSPCISLVGGVAVSTVWSDIEVHRRDYYTNDVDTVDPYNNLDLKTDRCALIPVTELLFGLRYDTTMCDCYDVFVFVGWENQVWWNLNRFIFVNSDSDGEGSSYQFGPHGNVTYQGLTVRAGFSF